MTKDGYSPFLSLSIIFFPCQDKGNLWDHVKGPRASTTICNFFMKKTLQSTDEWWDLKLVSRNNLILPYQTFLINFSLFLCYAYLKNKIITRDFHLDVKLNCQDSYRLGQQHHLVVHLKKTGRRISTRAVRESTVSNLMILWSKLIALTSGREDAVSVQRTVNSQQVTEERAGEPVRHIECTQDNHYPDANLQGLCYVVE